MAKQDKHGNRGKYRISETPITSSPRPSWTNEPNEIAFPPASDVPCLVAIARDPRTLFVCWSVDWPNVFVGGLPPDRCAHLRVRSRAESKTVGVEPTLGSCTIRDLDPGETYAIELGYYAPAESWHSVAVGNEVMMPLESEPAGEAIQVATIPLHLTFERLLNLTNESSPRVLAQTIARIQERGGKSENINPREIEFLHALGLSPEDLQKHAAYRDSLARSERIRDRRDAFAEAIGASPNQAFGGSSP